ncbi:MAG: HAD family hydrolase [Bacteroidales bacterium]|nr:HAD family hydrolase [Bacteroidales bacterium]
MSDLKLEQFDTLFLDRDGVINRHRPNDYVKTWEEFEFLPGVLDTLALLNKQFKHIVIVTNQRGIGKGVMSEPDLLEIHHNMRQEIQKHGGRIDKIYYCTAADDTDFFRKPNIGMALQAQKDFPDIDFSKSIMIGDSESDVQFAKNAGMKAIKVESSDFFHNFAKNFTL